MIETKHYTCIGCPVGCPLQLEHEGELIKEVSGYECDRGAKYARQEFTDPRRSLSTTVAVYGGVWPRLPVKVSAPIHKDRTLEAVRRIQALKIKAPVRMGQVLVKNFMGAKDLHVIACRSMQASASAPSTFDSDES